MPPTDLTRLDAQLQRLQLPYIQSHYQALATKAAEQQRSHLDYLEQLVEGEATMRENRSIERRIKNARFPVLKSLDDFQWSWPKKINRPQIQNLFRLAFIATQTNVVLIGNVGLGKTHLSIALGHAACLNGHSVLFTTAVEAANRAEPGTIFSCASQIANKTSCARSLRKQCPSPTIRPNATPA